MSQHLPTGCDPHPPDMTPGPGATPGHIAEHAERLSFHRDVLGLEPGDLVFDIGAHEGHRTALYLELGCKVVSVEPQLEAARLIDKRARVVCAAAGAEPGIGWMQPCPSQTYFSTLAGESYVRNVPAEYEETLIPVPVVTIDQLVGAFRLFGLPKFVKIDVEGYELEVLLGMHFSPEIVSFEVHDFDLEKMRACIVTLAGREFEYSRRESFELEPVPADEDLAMFGDIYARLR